MSAYIKYSDKLKDPRWQKKRLLIFERDKFTCQVCFSKEKTLHVHHKYYKPNCDPWDYEDTILVTLCENCHADEENLKIDANAEILPLLYSFDFLNADVLLFLSGLNTLRQSGTVITAGDFYGIFLYMSRPDNKEKITELVKDYFKTLNNG